MPDNVMYNISSLLSLHKGCIKNTAQIAIEMLNSNNSQAQIEIQHLSRPFSNLKPINTEYQPESTRNIRYLSDHT